MVAYWIKDIALEEEFTNNILDAFDDAGSDEDKKIIIVPSQDDTERTLICFPSHFTTDTQDSLFMCNFAKQERSFEKGRQMMCYKVIGCHYPRSQCSTGWLSKHKKRKKGNHVPRRKFMMQMTM